MNFKLGFIFLILGFTLITSCTKENIDTNLIEEEEVVAEVVLCNLSLVVTQDAAGVWTAEASGGTAPYLYVWSTGETTPNVTITVSGDYEVIATDINGCEISKAFGVSISDPCNSLSAAVDTNTTAAGTTLTANATGGTPPYVYEWQTGATTQSITATVSGNYTVTIIDNQGCTYSITTSVTVSTDPCNNLNVIIDTDMVGTTLIAIATGGTGVYTYLWSTGETTQSITVVVDGIYQVTVVDSQGCTYTNTITISPTVFPCNDLSLAFDLDAAGTLLSAVVSGGPNPYLYQWSTGETTSSIAVVSGETYTVEVEDANGCTATGSFMVP